MKKTVLFLVALVVSMTSAFSQVSGGLKAGMNLANTLSSEDGWDTDMVIGYHVGAFIDLSISESFSIQPELILSAQGSKSTYNDGGTDIEQKLKFSYLNIPILAKVKFANVFNIHAGPQFGFLMNGKMEVEDISLDMKDDLETLDMAIAAGVGVDLPMGLTLAARYNLGLSDIAKENDGDKIKNGVFQLSVGYTLFGK